MDSGIDWTSAIGVLVVGLALGGILVWRMRAAGEAAPATAASAPTPLERRDLEGRRDALLRQIAELDDTASKRSPEQLARERYALELETARVLMGIDEVPAAAPAGPAPAAGAVADSTAGPVPPTGAAAGDRPALRGFLWGTGSMAAVAALLFFVTQAARPRDPGGLPTGDLPASAASEPASADEARLQAAIERDPDDLDARIALANAYLGRGDMMGVWNETQQVLARSPGHPRALSYQALVRLAMGQADVAREMLEQAIATDPDVPDAYVPLSVALTRLGRTEEAARTLAEARRRFPDQEEAIARFESRLREAVGEAPASGEENPHAAVPPPGAPAEAPAAQAPPAAPKAALGKAVGGRLDLDPSLRGQVEGSVLFLIVRAAGVEAGPPLAVQRIVPAAYPVLFAIGEDDSMTGAPLPDEVLLDARLDSDGDPSTRPPSDPRARADSVRLGTSDLELVLRRGN